MKIRAITTGFIVEPAFYCEQFERVGKLNKKLKKYFEDKGFLVEDTRIVTNPFEEYVDKKNPVKKLVDIDKCASLTGNRFLSIGYGSDPYFIKVIPDILKNTKTISCSSFIGSKDKGILTKNVKETALIFKKIAKKRESKNFNFCASVNCPPYIPFFPAAYHNGLAGFSIAVESGDIVFKAFRNSVNLSDARKNLIELMSENLSKIEKVAFDISYKTGLVYYGIDSSPAPSLEKEGSIGFAFEEIDFVERFGSSGTLSVAAIITDGVRNLPIKQCGYSGLMLSVCEDRGVAKRYGEGNFSVKELLLYSSVCGCGIDTLPIPYDTDEEVIERLLFDVASLSLKLDKPLSVRLLPVKGDKTNFKSPYLIDTKVFRLT